MSDKVFFDTNIVFYAFDSSEPVKQAVAQTLLADGIDQGIVVLSTQVLGEFFHTTVVRKRTHSADEALQAIAALSAAEIVQIDLSLVITAIEFHKRFQVAYWDGLILAAAEHSGCGEVLTEDFNSGQNYAGVRARNPFSP